MVGEIRDTETAKIAVRASITGHLVLSTIHTNDSLNTIERLLEMDVERYLLSSALTGIISQKLARKLCPHCHTKRPTSQYEKDIFRKVLGRDVNEIYSAVGCDHCGNGYSGRIAIHEVLMINQDIKDAISENIRKEALRELVYNSDVITLLQDGLEKVEKGLTTFEEILKIIELEDDEKLANASSLQTALDYIDISHGNDINRDDYGIGSSVENVQPEIQNAVSEVQVSDVTQNIVQNNDTIQSDVSSAQQEANTPVVEQPTVQIQQSNEPVQSVEYTQDIPYVQQPETQPTAQPEIVQSVNTNNVENMVDGNSNVQSNDLDNTAKSHGTLNDLLNRINKNNS